MTETKFIIKKIDPPSVNPIPVYLEKITKSDTVYTPFIRRANEYETYPNAEDSIKLLLLQSPEAYFQIEKIYKKV